MKRHLVRIQNKQKYDVKDTSYVLREARKIILDNLRLGNLRISSNAIEFDIFTDEDQKIQENLRPVFITIGKLLSIKSIFEENMKKGEKETIMEGVKFFNEERFWECHDAFEKMWKTKRNNERHLLQGIILTAAALVHYQKNEIEICLSMLNRALLKLVWEKSEYYNIDIANFKRNIERIILAKEVRIFKIKFN